MKTKYFLLLLLSFVLYWMIQLYQPFLKNIAIASLLAIATYNINSWFYNKTKKQGLSAFLTTSLLAILFFGTIFYAINTTISLSNNLNLEPIKTFISDIKNYKNHLPNSLGFIKPKLDEFLSSIQINKLASYIFSITTYLASKSATFVKDMALIIVFYFFALLYGKDIFTFFKKAMPIEDKTIAKLSDEISSVMGVVFYSIIITAMFEGLLFSILGIFFDYDPIFLGIMYGFSSLIPVVGGAIMWIPLAILEYSHGNTTNAIIISVYSIVVISIIADTFVKPIIIKFINEKLTKHPTYINELLIFFAIIAGLSTFGFWGMILGPAITTFFISIIKLYQK